MLERKTRFTVASYSLIAVELLRGPYEISIESVGFDRKVLTNFLVKSDAASQLTISLTPQHTYPCPMGERGGLLIERVKRAPLRKNRSKKIF